MKFDMELDLKHSANYTWNIVCLSTVTDMWWSKPWFYIII